MLSKDWWCIGEFIATYVNFVATLNTGSVVFHNLYSTLILCHIILCTICWHYCLTFYLFLHLCSSTVENKSIPDNFLVDELAGELCYVQTVDGKIVAIHHEMTDSFEGVNIKRSIASIFQANYNTITKDVEEVDAGSVHTSHYR